jgi:hypothetical protein
VHFHGGFGGPKMRPWKYRQAQIDGRRIQCIDGVAQVQTKIFPGIQPPRLNDQPLRQFGMDAPIAQLISLTVSKTIRKPVLSMGYRKAEHVRKLHGFNALYKN